MREEILSSSENLANQPNAKVFSKQANLISRGIVRTSLDKYISTHHRNIQSNHAFIVVLLCFSYL